MVLFRVVVLLDHDPRWFMSSAEHWEHVGVEEEGRLLMVSITPFTLRTRQDLHVSCWKHPQVKIVGLLAGHGLQIAIRASRRVGEASSRPHSCVVAYSSSSLSGNGLGLGDVGSAVRFISELGVQTAIHVIALLRSWLWGTGIGDKVVEVRVVVGHGSRRDLVLVSVRC